MSILAYASQLISEPESRSDDAMAVLILPVQGTELDPHYSFCVNRED